MITAAPKLARSEGDTQASFLCNVYVRREMVGVWGLSIGSLARKLLREDVVAMGFGREKTVEG